MFPANRRRMMKRTSGASPRKKKSHIVPGTRVKSGVSNVTAYKPFEPVKPSTTKILTPKKKQTNFGTGWGP